MEQKKLSVMIVDDDKFLLGMYSLKFQNNGLEAEAVLGSVEALKKLREGANPDILLLDIIMPHMTGLALLKTIREENLASRSVVIMLTNQSESSDIEAAKALGAEGYIVKASTIPSDVLTEGLKIYEKNKAQKK